MSKKFFKLLFNFLGMALVFGFQFAPTSLHARADFPRKDMNLVFSTIMKESRKFLFDPIMLISVIEVESGFRVKKRGSHGEIGLMQLKPSTAAWIAKKNGLPWNGPKTLEDPVANIQIGTAFLFLLRKNFPTQKQLYLSAYNMGGGHLRRAMRNQRVPMEYSSRVMRRYRRLYSRMALSGTSMSL